MTETTREPKAKRAVVYIRGEDETLQKLLCYFYATDNDMDVLFDTRNIEDVADCEDCNVLLTANASRISRNAIEYHRIVKALKMKGIEVVFASTPENSERLINFMRSEF